MTNDQDIKHEGLSQKLINRWPESHPQPSLDRIKALCNLLADPQEACPVIQITGTNGKGSTAIMIDALIRAMGLRTGRFSSPHLGDGRERSCVDGEPISKERFDELYEEIEPFVQMVDEQKIGGVKMTFFEVITAMAYAAFADAPVDVAIMEVGMGGKWDATSVADAKVGVVGPIALDHMHLLGDTVAEIAEEKSGVVKHGGVGVFAGQQPEAASVLTKRCVEVGASMKREGIDFGLLDRQPGVGGQLIRIDTSGGPVSDIFLPLFGAHMAHNAALAVAAVEAFQGGKPLNPEIINEGLGNVKAPARLELVHSEPTVILDTAHNPHGVKATLAGLREVFPDNPVICVCAMMADKQTGKVLEMLSDEVDYLIATTIPDNPRADSAADFADQAQGAFGAGRVRMSERPEEALAIAMGMADTRADDAVVLVLGSVYLAGLIRPRLIDENNTEKASWQVDVISSKEELK